MLLVAPLFYTCFSKDILQTKTAKIYHQKRRNRINKLVTESTGRRHLDFE